MRKQGIVAVTGATGFIGSYLAAGLEREGYSVRPLSRDGGERPEFCSVGDLGDSPRWTECLAGVDTVIHCAALAHQPVDNAPELRDRLYRVNCNAVRSLAEACREMGVRRLIFLSSVKVYGESTFGRPPFSEIDPLFPEDDYGRSKCQAESILKDYDCEGLQICSLRLPLVYGPEAKANFRRLQKLAMSGLPLPLAGICNRRSILGTPNLLTVVECLLEKDRWPFFALNVADPEPVSVSGLVEILREAAGKPIRLFFVPESVIRACGRLLGLGGQINKLAGNLEISLDRLREQLPEAELMPTRTSLMQQGAKVSGSMSGLKGTLAP